MARTIVIAVLTVGSLAWLWGLANLAAAGRETRGDEADRYGPDEPAAGPLLTGSEEVAGTPAELSRRAAASLAGQVENRWFGPIRIREATDAEVRFDGPEPGSGLAAGVLRRGELRFEWVGPDRTRVSYLAVMAGGRGLILAGWIVQGLGLLALIGGAWAALGYAVPSANPAVRAQAVQVVQVVHLLWPPFLFAALARGRRRSLRAAFESVIANLPHRELRPFTMIGGEGRA